MDITYSIVVPVFNSASTLVKLVDDLKDTLREYSFEIILVDDGSNDDSWAQIKELKKENTALIKAIRLSKNFGQHNATLCGLEKSIGQYVITIDDDLQTPTKEINKLIACYNETQADVVFGLHKDPKQPLIKKIGKRFVKTFFSNLNEYEGSSFRLIKKDIVSKIVKEIQFFIRIDELLSWYTHKISHTEVEHVQRGSGKSGYSSIAVLKLAINILLNHYTLPLKFITSLGFYISFFSVLLGIYYLIKKLFFNVWIEGWTSLIVTILFSTGVIVFTLGILGKYILHMIHLLNKKPGYSIAEEL